MEPEIEDFEITDRDLQDEFNPNRYRGRFTKNMATYGIWAEESDEEERPSFGGGRKPAKNYTAPVGFVSGGVKVGDKVTKAQDGDEEEEDDPNKSDSDDEFDRQVFPVDFGEGSRGRGGGRGRSQPARSAYVGRRGQRDDDQGIGDWEKHTRGIGQKLLEKMGYIQGKGLGKNQQGISTPVEAAKRKGKAAIGYYGTERTERSLRDFPAKPSADEEEEEKFRQQLHQWKKSEPGKKKKPKYVYKTAEELISTGSATTRRTAAPQSQLSKVKVIDMTGREQRVLSGYHAIAHKHDKPDEDEFVAHSRTMEKKAFDMPELLHNLDLLVDMAEEEIIQNDRKLRHEKDMIVNLNHEREKISAVCEQEEKHIRRMKEVLNIIERCEERSKPDATDPLTLEDCAGLLKMIQDNYYEEYRMYELWVLAVALVFPLMKKEFDGWDPLRRPRHGIGTLRTWRNLLEDSSRQRDAVLDAYQRLIWEIWMPHIRTAVKNWSARHCDSLIEVLEAWTPMVPPWVLDNILEQLVLPRLQTEVEDWNPLTDTMPIHAWLHPWLPLMGNRLEPLYDPIRHKLANALNKWHPSDPSAKMILQPWVDVFSRAKMNSFLLKHIVPKLQICMQQFVINPHQQHLDAWTWVTSWLDIMPIPSMVDLLDKHFFPKWLQVLCTWLSNNPNYDEVTKWYRGWKSMFPDNLLAEPIIKNHFNKALDIMNRAVSGPYQSMAGRDNPAYYQPGARENIAYLTHTERRANVDVRAQEMVRGASASSTIPDTFKEMIERRAEENNLLFMPIPKKTYEAKQVYRVGTVQFYIDRQVVFMLDRTSWVPVSVNALVDRARMESRL